MTSGHVGGRSLRVLLAAAVSLACACQRSNGPVRASAAGPEAGVRIVSFNAWCMPPPFSEDVDGRSARMPAALRALNPDVICLQEVWTPHVRSLLQRAFSPEYAAARSAEGGLMVLSRLPILKERFTRFPRVPGMSLVEGIVGKGMLEVEIGTPLGPLRVVDAHLASGDPVGRDGQLRFLLAEVGRDLPLVVAVDTNFWKVWQDALTPQYESVLAHGWRDAAPPRRTAQGFDAGEPTRPGWPRDRGDEWGPTFPDHVFYASAKGATLRVAAFRQALDAPETALSDHNALVADFSLERAD